MSCWRAAGSDVTLLLQQSANLVRIIMTLIYAIFSNVLMHVSVKQKCFQFVAERVQQDVCRLQIIWHAVPRSWSADKESLITATCFCACYDELARVGRS